MAWDQCPNAFLFIFFFGGGVHTDREAILCDAQKVERHKKEKGENVS